MGTINRQDSKTLTTCLTRKLKYKLSKTIKLTAASSKKSMLSANNETELILLPTSNSTKKYNRLATATKITACCSANLRADIILKNFIKRVEQVEKISKNNEYYSYQII